MRGIGDGTLDEERFRFYVRQDYRYLIDYGRLLSLGAARAPRLEDMRRFAALAQAVLEVEMTLHVGFAEQWGIAAAELEAEPAAPGDRRLRRLPPAHGDGRRLRRARRRAAAVHVGLRGDRRAARRGRPADHAGYAAWIAMYADPEFQALAAWCRELTDAAGADAGPGARARMHAAFRASSEHELAFWEAAWTLDAAPADGSVAP